MDLVKQKQIMKKKKPVFISQNSHKIKSVPRKWRRPRGIHSKMRDKRKGHKKMVSPGYGTPKILRGMNTEGKKEHIIRSLDELKNTEKNSLIVLSSTLGKRKALQIIEEAKNKELIIKNIDIQKFLEKIEKEKQEKEKKRKTVEEKKKKKEQESEKKPKNEEKPLTEKTELSEEEKKKQEKKEMDKLLTQKSI